jgi:hypothetical protein
MTSLALPQASDFFVNTKIIITFARLKKPQRFFGAMGCLKKSTE